MYPGPTAGLAQGKGPPLICIHPIDGEILAYRELAEHLRGRRPVFGLRAGQMHCADVASLARAYLKLLEGRIQGPLHLLGYSAGAAIALEMALQLQQCGKQAGWLGVVDLPAPGSSFWDVSRIHWGSLLRELPWRWRDRSWSLRPVLRLLSRLLKGWLGWKDSSVGSYRQGPDWLARALNAYQPTQSCRLKVTVFRCPVQPLLSSHAPDLGWSEVCRQSEVVLVDAPHEHLLRQSLLWEHLS